MSDEEKSEKTREKEEKKKAVKITNQFRDRQGLVYDLNCEGVRVTITITPRQNQESKGDWTVEARAKEAPEPPVISESATSKKEALEAVAATWAAKAGGEGFPTVDWVGITTALTAVRAI